MIRLSEFSPSSFWSLFLILISTSLLCCTADKLLTYLDFMWYIAEGEDKKRYLRVSFLFGSCEERIVLLQVYLEIRGLF